jgi:hypothetical protein
MTKIIRIVVSIVGLLFLVGCGEESTLPQKEVEKDEITLQHYIDGYSVTKVSDARFLTGLFEVDESSYILGFSNGNILNVDKDSNVLWQYNFEDIHHIIYTHRLDDNRVGIYGANNYDSIRDESFFYAILSENGELENRVNLFDKGIWSIVNIVEVEDGYIAAGRSTSQSKNSIWKLDKNFDVIWEYEYNDGYLFDIFVTDNNTVKVYGFKSNELKQEYYYVTSELSQTGELIERIQHDPVSDYYININLMWDDALSCGSTLYQFREPNIKDYSLDSDEYIDSRYLIRLEDGTYNLYGIQHLINKTSTRNPNVYYLDTDMNLTGSDLFDQNDSFPCWTIVNSDNDYVHVFFTRSTKKLFSDNTGESIYLIIKDDENLDFSTED